MAVWALHQEPQKSEWKANKYGPEISHHMDRIRKITRVTTVVHTSMSRRLHYTPFFESSKAKRQLHQERM